MRLMVFLLTNTRKPKGLCAPYLEKSLTCLKTVLKCDAWFKKSVADTQAVRQVSFGAAG